MLEMGVMEKRTRELMDKGYDFTDGTAFARVYNQTYNTVISHAYIKKYGVKYQNELEAAGKPLPWKHNDDGLLPTNTPEAQLTDIMENNEVEAIAEVEAEAAVMDADESVINDDVDATSSLNDTLTSINTREKTLISVISDVNYVNGLVNFTDEGDMHALLNIIERVGVKRFRAAYDFIKTMESTEE